jgi:hypothetical protein
MKRGDVVFWPLFTFGGTETASDKLLVVVGSDADGGWLVFRTTSQASVYRPDGDGCHADQSVFRFNSNPAPFHKATWVQYEGSYVIGEEDMKRKGAKVSFSLSDDQIRAIINCFKASPEVSTWLWSYCK